MSKTTAEHHPGYLFCGDRYWGDRYVVELLIRGLKSWAKELREGICIVHGAAQGADTIAGNAAVLAGLDTYAYHAEWTKYGKAAGPRRNQQMLDEENIKIVFAFHDDLEDSRGTKDMIRRALKRGIPVYHVRRVEKI